MQPVNENLGEDTAQYEYAAALESGSESDHQERRAAPARTQTGEYIHPDAARMFEACPLLGHLPIFSKSCEGFGPKCVLSLGLVYFFSKGIGNNLIGYSKYAMFRNRFGIDGTRYQRLQGIAKMGWSIKPFMAMLTDVFALFGYTKRWYMAGSAVLGAAFCLGYALLPAAASSADIGAGFMFLTSFGMANIDILSEGHYSRLMRRSPASGPSLVSWIWWFIMGAGIIAAAMNGPIADLKKPQVSVFISAAAQFVVVFFFVLNWYGEKTNREERAEDARTVHEELLKLQAAARAEESTTVPAKNLHPELDSENDDTPAHPEARQNHLNDELGDEHDHAYPAKVNPELVVADVADDVIELEEPVLRELCCGAFELNAEMCARNWRVLAYSVLMTCAVVTMTCVTIMGTSWQLLYASIVVGVVCVAAAFLCLPLVIAKVNVFVYLHMLLYLQVSGPVDSFYMATPECIADGPHFSYTFYSTVGAIIGNVGGIIGVTMFSYIFSKHTYRLTFIVTTTIQVLASVFDIVMVKRWNMAIGIPDHAMYLLGDAIVYEVCYMLAWMPTVLLLSRICPRGSESMVYALVAGFGNLGQSMSSTIGSLLTELVWTFNTKEGSCNFDNVPMLLLVGHMLMPLAIIPFCFLLIPAARVCDDIDVDGHTIKKEAKRRAEMGNQVNADDVCDTAEPFSEKADERRSGKP